MALSTSSPLYATAMYDASSAVGRRSPCASPATSTDSLSEDARGPAPSTPLSKLPGLQFAISHRRGDLRLPLLSTGRAYENANNANTNTNAESVGMNQRQHALYLSIPQCETPHYLPGAPVCPETSPLDKKSCSDKDLDANGKKRKKGTRRGTLNAEAKNVLKAWMFSPEHFAHPYPSEDEKEELALEAGIEVKQLSNWFTNARKRLWQPVLRQSGVEVKNFLSTGRGGPRGNKLDVPANLQHLIAQKAAEDEASCSPPTSPCASLENGIADDSRLASLKRSWSDVQASSPAPSSVLTKADEVAPKKKKIAIRKRAGKKTGDEDAMAPTSTASQLSQELRHALATHHHHHNHSMASPTTREPAVNQFKDIEILAAASLIGLHLQPVYQPVH